MFKEFSQDIPAKSISYIIICGGIVLIIVLLGILPLSRYNAGRSGDLKKLQDQIQEQKGLRQVQQMLQTASGKKNVYLLPNPAKLKLPRRDVDKFQDAFRREAGKAGLRTLMLKPDMNTFLPGSPIAFFDAKLKGEFPNFRDMLISLGELPYLEGIEEVRMTQGSGAMEFRIRLGITLAN